MTLASSTPPSKLMIEAVRRYDGYVVQSTGDGTFALFRRTGRTRGPSAARSHTALRMSRNGGKTGGRLIKHAR
jgi:hypothetical protein